MDDVLLRARATRIAAAVLPLIVAGTLAAPPAPARAVAAAGVVAHAAVPAFPSGMVLRIGSRGPQVAAVQDALTRRGYRIGPHTRGVYDASTAAAVKRYKLKRPGLGTSNMVGPRTYASITGGSSSGSGGPTTPTRPTPSTWATWRSRSGLDYTTPDYAQWYAIRRLASYGWASGQMACLRPMWKAESHWQYRAASATGKYLGIPQTTSGTITRYGFTVAVYRANPEAQVEVGLRYIRDRYGSPCEAWAFWKRQGARQDRSDPSQWWGGWY